jgi:hypothetical protein
MHFIPCILDEKNSFFVGRGLFEIDNTAAGRKERDKLVTNYQYLVERIAAPKTAIITSGTSLSMPGLQLRGGEQGTEPV